MEVTGKQAAERILARVRSIGEQITKLENERTELLNGLGRNEEVLSVLLSSVQEVAPPQPLSSPSPPLLPLSSPASLPPPLPLLYPPPSLLPSTSREPLQLGLYALRMPHPDSWRARVLACLYEDPKKVWTSKMLSKVLGRKRQSVGADLHKLYTLGYIKWLKRGHYSALTP